MKPKKQIVEERTAKIPAIREMRENGKSIADVARAFSVSSNFVTEQCKDIKVNTRGRLKSKAPLFKNTLPFQSYKFDELSPEDKKKYLDLQPHQKEEDKDTYITGSKGKYYKAAIFQDSKRGIESI